jgi:protein-tyrosine phosphatase
MTQTAKATFPITDLHSHLLPDVDDGTRTLAESIEALEGLYREGVRAAVTTPHLLLPHLPTNAALDRELDRQHRAFDQLGILLQQRNELPELLLGQEIWAPDAASVRRVTGRREVGLPGRFLLVEFGFTLQGDHNEVVREVLDAGRQILIAHPERYHYLPGAEPMEVMRCWQDLGALLQINVGSLSGHYEGSSPGSSRLAWRMIDTGMVDVIATDHHGPRRRGVSPAEGLQELIDRGASAVAQRLMGENPTRIMRDDLLPSGLPGQGRGADRLEQEPGRP